MIAAHRVAVATRSSLEIRPDAASRGFLAAAYRLVLRED
jgi:hypothetical protein